MQFEKLNIIPPILKALKEQNYESATPIQIKAIPAILAKKDILASAQTGTGKTAAFAIPILQQLVEEKAQSGSHHRIRALIITPTRELAIQIGENFTFYSKHIGIKNTVIFGGVNQAGQVDKVKRGVEVLIATPGRLLDLMNQGYVSLNDIKYFVLDEADRMLDMGFINDIKKVIAKLPVKRQTLFFSATLPADSVNLAKTILTNPETIVVSPVSSTAETIQQYLYYTNKSSKKDLLFYILEDNRIDQVLLFSKTKHGADRIVKNLVERNISALAIHGDKAQNQRQNALNKFKAKEVRVLVATDIAARGIDIDKLSHVINYDIPNEPETYVHRIGRSGRAGEEGVAISMCEPEENDFLKDIERLIKQRINVVDNHPYPQTDAPMNAREKKEFEKEKMKIKQAFFDAKRKREGGSGRDGGSGARKKDKLVEMVKHLTPRIVFLIDALGASVSFVLLGFVLPYFVAFTGMPSHVFFIYLLGWLFCLQFIRFFCFKLNPQNWRPYLITIALANLLYCLFTILMVFYSSLSIFGIIYFALEIIVIVLLASFELRTAQFSSKI